MASTPKPAQAINPLVVKVGVGALKILGEKVLEKCAGMLVDKVFDSGEQADIDKAIAEYRSALAQESAESQARYQELTAKIEFFRAEMEKIAIKQRQQEQGLSDLRSEVETRTSAERLRGMIKQELALLEVRTTVLEDRQNVISDRIGEIEKALGFLSTVPLDPAPLISEPEAGQPAVHPLTKDWAQLLVAGEVNRVTLAELQRDYADTAPEVAAARAEAEAIHVRVTKLREELRAEAAKITTERQALLAKYKPSHAEVRKYDRRIASLLWLIGISRPPTDDASGRLGIPEELLGPSCSEILIAMNLSGVTDESLVPLFRSLTHVPVSGAPLEGDGSVLSAKLSDIEGEAISLRVRGDELVSSVLGTEVKDRLGRINYSDAHPQRVALYDNRKSALATAAKLHVDLDAFLKRAYLGYIGEIRQTRPSSAAMLEFRANCLERMERLETMTSQADPTLGQSEEAWRNLCDTRGFDFGRAGSTKRMVLRSGVAITLCFIPSEKGTGRGFWLGQTELSQAQWRAAGGEAEAKPTFVGEDLPIDNLNWTECERLTKRLNRQVPLPFGWKWALPSQAQWQYACKAGVSEPFNIGGTGKKWLGINEVNCASSDANINQGRTFPALPDTTKFFPPNNWGLYHMHGNVYEWCSDAVLCGGAWGARVEDCAADATLWAGQKTTRGDRSGVRLAAVPAM